MSTSTQPPVSQLREFLAQYRGGAAFHPPLVDDKGALVGNNGDRLMVLGTDKVYAELGIRRVDDPAAANLLVLGASGGMLDSFTHIPRLFRWMSTTFPDRPMCVLPSTFFYKHRPIAEDIGSRSAPLTMFCRERYSFDHLRNDHALPACCEVVLDHDMAFELEESEYVSRVRAMEPRHVLLVERVDVEHPSHALTSTSARMRARKWAGRCMPPGLKRSLYPLVRYVRSRQNTSFRQQCEQLLREHHVEHAGLPRLVADISNVHTCTFEEFTDAIGHAAAIFTTRLHVAILGAMAARPTFVFEGPYHKIRGIHEHSLAERPGVSFVPLAGGSA